MTINSIQVEGGFLDGLDLSLKKGLNTLIGARGAGKTSVIELIRFCLGSTALTEKIAQKAREHALSILGTGTVTVTVEEGGNIVTMSRSAENWTTSSVGTRRPPIVLSQNEIESIGLSAASRLKLIDSIRSGGEPEVEEEDRLLTFIRSETEERRSTFAELQNIRIQLTQLSEQLKEADILKKQHQDALAGIKKATGQTTRLAQLTGWLSTLSVRAGVYNRTLQVLNHWRSRLQSQASLSLSIEEWPEAAGPNDPLTRVRGVSENVKKNLHQAIDHVDAAIKDVNGLLEQNSAEVAKFETEARELRRQLEALEKGAGETARKLAFIQERAGQLSALRELERAKLEQLKRIQAERKRNLDELESIRIKRFEARRSLVQELNDELGPQIRISLERAGQNTQYASAIVAALRGSGLRANEVAPSIADQMSPREFVEAVENTDVEALVSATSLNSSRAARIIERINEQGVETILTAPVEDGVTLCLLDGREYKTTEQLSTGQRCTVILPLLLKQHTLSLVVDQPEDHLDNAFIVGTLIKSILSRKHDGQLIFSTHNPNIPVLGEADYVVEMASDGSRGFVRHSGPLDDPPIVSAITSLMEGGIQAFDRRGRFYHKSDVDEPV